MFSVLTRSLARRTISRSLRCMSKRSAPPNKRIRNTPESVSKNGTAPKSSVDEPQQPSSTKSEPTLDIGSGRIATLDFSPPEMEKEFQRTGARSSKGSLSSSEKKRRFVGRITLTLLALGFGAHTVYMGREWDDDELKAMKTVSP